MGSKGDNNRDRIIDAANELFYKQGYSKTSFAEIAKAAGIPKGNFYFYFPSKADLLSGVLEDRSKRLRGLLESWEQTVADPRDRLKRVAAIPGTDCDAITRYGCPMGSLGTELGKNLADRQDGARAVFTLLMDWTERQFAALVGKKQAPQLTRQLFNRLQGASVLANVYQDSSRITEEVASATEWIDGL